MKRLLLGPAVIAIPLALFGCSNWGTKTPELPKVPEVIRQIPLDNFDTLPAHPPRSAAPVVKKPKAPKPHAAAHRRLLHALYLALDRMWIKLRWRRYLRSRARSASFR
jgi:hypothetical protein